MSDEETRFGELKRLLRRFVSGEDRSQRFVREEIGDLPEQRFPGGAGFPDAALFEDLEVAVGCYRPEGGQFMYDEEQMTAICAAILSALEPLP